MQNRTPDTQGSTPGKNSDVRQGGSVPGQGGMDRDNKKAQGMDDDRKLQGDRNQQSKPGEDRSKSGSQDRSKTGPQNTQGGQRTN